MDIEPGDIVQWGLSGPYVVVDVADHGRDGKFAPLRLQDGDPRRELNPDGSDRILAAPRTEELVKIGHI